MTESKDFNRSDDPEPEEIDAAEILKAARARLEAVLAEARAACDECQETLREKTAAAEEQIRQHPFRALGLAFGAGLLMGLFLNRK